MESGGKIYERQFKDVIDDSDDNRRVSTSPSLVKTKICIRYPWCGIAFVVF